MNEGSQERPEAWRSQEGVFPEEGVKQGALHLSPGRQRETETSPSQRGQNQIQED